MWGFMLVFLLLVFIFTILAVCYQARKASISRQGAAPAQQGAQLPARQNGGRVGAAAAAGAASPHHILIVGVPHGFPQQQQQQQQQPARAARPGPRAAARQQLPDGKLPTPPSVIANLPSFNYSPPRGNGGGGNGRGSGAAAEGGVAAAAAAAAAGTGAGAEAGANMARQDSSEGRPMCVICCEEFQQGTRVKLLPCMHSFCSECIDAWLARDVHCPICKDSVIRAAGLSEADAFEIAVSGQQQQQAQRQPGGGDGGGGAAAAHRRGPDLLLQAQQQRLLQLQLAGRA